jgi:uncharacterized protein
MFSFNFLWFGLIILPILIYILACIIFFFKQDKMIFSPFSKVEKTPQDFGLNYEEILIPIPNSHRDNYLFGWWIPCESEKVLLYFYGTHCNIESTLETGAFFHQLGFSVFLFDYRGFGNSKGAFPSEKQVYEDGQIVWDFLTKTQNINPLNILVYGHSLGGAIAIELAVNNPQVSGLILQSSFTNLQEVLKNYTRFKFFPLQFLLKYKFNVINKIASLQIPLLFIHGKKDQSVPYSMSEKLFTHSATSFKKLVLIPQADHSDMLKVDPKLYKKAIKNIIIELYN